MMAVYEFYHRIDLFFSGLCLCCMMAFYDSITELTG